MKQSSSFFTIGLTGGAGSGKTTVVECVQKSFPTRFLHCDVIAHELMQPGEASYIALVAEYGEEILKQPEPGQSPEDKPEIDRAKLAAVALATKEKAGRLNEITHPRVRKRVEELLEQLRNEQFCGVVIIEAALFIEAGYSDLCDELWYVSAPVEDRILRMKQNRGYSEEKIQNILRSQLSEEEFLKHADVVIYNPDSENRDGFLHLEQQISARMKQILEENGSFERTTGK